MLQYGNVDCTGKYHKLLTEEWKYGCNDPPLPPPLPMTRPALRQWFYAYSVTTWNLVQKTLTKGEGTSPNNAYSFTKI